MTQCNKLDIENINGKNVATSKTSTMILKTKKDLLTYCLECDKQEHCKDVVKMYVDIGR